MSRFGPPAALLFAGAFALAGCTIQTNPYPPVPAARTEVVPAPPVSATPQEWEPGHWTWTGQSYSWVPGQWVARASRGATWQNGYWARDPTTGAWAWQPGRWVD